RAAARRNRRAPAACRRSPAAPPRRSQRRRAPEELELVSGERVDDAVRPDLEGGAPVAGGEGDGEAVGARRLLEIALLQQAEERPHAVLLDRRRLAGLLRLEADADLTDAARTRPLHLHGSRRPVIIGDRLAVDVDDNLR